MCLYLSKEAIYLSFLYVFGYYSKIWVFFFVLWFLFVWVLINFLFENFILISQICSCSCEMYPLIYTYVKAHAHIYTHARSKTYSHIYIFLHAQIIALSLSLTQSKTQKVALSHTHIHIHPLEILLTNILTHYYVLILKYKFLYIKKILEEGFMKLYNWFIRLELGVCWKYFLNST